MIESQEALLFIISNAGKISTILGSYCMLKIAVFVLKKNHQTEGKRDRRHIVVDKVSEREKERERERYFEQRRFLVLHSSKETPRTIPVCYFSRNIFKTTMRYSKIALALFFVTAAAVGGTSSRRNKTAKKAGGGEGNGAGMVRRSSLDGTYEYLSRDQTIVQVTIGCGEDFGEFDDPDLCLWSEFSLGNVVATPEPGSTPWGEEGLQFLPNPALPEDGTIHPDRVCVRSGTFRHSASMVEDEEGDQLHLKAIPLASSHGCNNLYTNFQLVVKGTMKPAEEEDAAAAAAHDIDGTILELDISDDFGATYYTDTKVCPHTYIARKVPTEEEEKKKRGHPRALDAVRRHDTRSLPQQQRRLPSTMDACVKTNPSTPMPTNSGGEDCPRCTSATVIEVSGNDFRTKVKQCIDGNCQDDVPIGCWDTSKVTDMSWAFAQTASFNDSINCWNTASVTSMNAMFGRATNFNQPLDDWNVASVTTMSSMFQQANNFNQPLDDWDVARVNWLSRMFYYASNFNQCLSSWAEKWDAKNRQQFQFGFNSIFENSGCPYKNPNPLVGPWCQGDNEQCYIVRKCEAGYYCASMTPQQGCGECRECEAGYYCPTGSSTKEGAGKCDVGYYCLAGSASSQGSGRCDGSYYCPTGSSTKEGLGLMEELLAAC